MAKHRIGRINDEMQKELAASLREVTDPRVSSAFISISGVDATPDLKYAKVYYSAIGGDISGDEYAIVEALSADTKTEIPAPISNLKSATVRFKNIAEKDNMAKVVLEFLGL